MLLALLYGFLRLLLDLLLVRCRPGLVPAPRRGQRSWREFVRQHADQMLAVDFFTVETVRLQRLHVLFFLEVGSRCVHLAGCTASLTGAWVAQQAWQLAWLLQDGKVRTRYLLRDRDTKFSAGFEWVFRSEGVKVIRLPYRSPRANSFADVGGNSEARGLGPPADLRVPPSGARAAGVRRALRGSAAAPRVGAAHASTG